MSNATIASGWHAVVNDKGVLVPGTTYQSQSLSAGYASAVAGIEWEELILMGYRLVEVNVTVSRWADALPPTEKTATPAADTAGETPPAVRHLFNRMAIPQK